MALKMGESPMYMPGAMGMPSLMGMPGMTGPPVAAGGPQHPSFTPQPNASQVSGPAHSQLTTSAPRRAPRERRPLAIFDNTGKLVKNESIYSDTASDADVAADGYPQTQSAAFQPAAARLPKERSRGLQLLDPKTNKPLSADDLDKKALQKRVQAQPPALASVSSTDSGGMINEMDWRAGRQRMEQQRRDAGGRRGGGGRGGGGRGGGAEKGPPAVGFASRCRGAVIEKRDEWERGRARRRRRLA